MKTKIGIVILNYLNWSDTIECLESLKLQTNQDFEAVVVENGSHNESTYELELKCSEQDNFHLVSVKKNLGFANGNNIGIHFLKKHYSINKILVVNNDVIFDDIYYLEKLVSVKYDKSIGAIGTKIIGSDGINQNPAYFPISLKSTVKSLIVNSLAFSKLWTFIKRKYLGELAKKSNDFSGPKSKNQKYYLHGSAIFFTENFLDRFDGFYGGTFLYYEEVILGVVFEKAGLEMVYIPEFSIYHKEDQSSLQSFNNDDLVRRKFLLKSIISSFPIYFSTTKTVQKIVNSSIEIEVIN